MKKKDDWNESLDEFLSSSNVEDLEFDEMVINADFVITILALMKENNIKTRKELAKKLGLSSAYITKVFSSDKFINVNFLARLQRVFNVSFQLTTSDYLNNLKKKNSETKVVWVFSEYNKVLVKDNGIYNQEIGSSIVVNDIGKLELDYVTTLQQ